MDMRTKYKGATVVETFLKHPQESDAVSHADDDMTRVTQIWTRDRSYAGVSYLARTEY